MSSDPDGEMPAAMVASTASAMPEDSVRRWRAELHSSLALWREDGGHLVATEPDPDERRRIRDHLRVAIETLDRVLGDPPTNIVGTVPYARG